MREVVRDASSETGLALTEGHVSFDPQTRIPSCEWLSAVYHARTMNIYQRNADVAVSGAVGECRGVDARGVSRVLRGLPTNAIFLRWWRRATDDEQT
jgi:hypothetical protein